jgi:TatA/E family protein of Tat protein translocase
MVINLLLFLESIGTGELILIILVVFLFYGPKKMPEIAHKLGKILNEMKKASNDITREFNNQVAPLRDEFISARDEIKNQTDGLKQEFESTKNTVVENLNYQPSKPLNEDDSIDKAKEETKEDSLNKDNFSTGNNPMAG